jgi:hypothetical protein
MSESQERMGRRAIGSDAQVAHALGACGYNRAGARAALGPARRFHLGVVQGMKSEILGALLEFLRSRTGKWDVVKDAIRSKDRAVRLIAVILALTPPVIAMLAAYLAVAR